MVKVISLGPFFFLPSVGEDDKRGGEDRFSTTDHTLDSTSTADNNEEEEEEEEEEVVDVGRLRNRTYDLTISFES
jgi:hypothetical protein